MTAPEISAAEIRRRIDALAVALADNGELSDDRWRQALHAVPRHLFVPDVAWINPDGEGGHRLDARSDPMAWLDAAYTNRSIVTQLDDGTIDVGTGEGTYTSSLSAPGVVVDFLELLDPFDGHHVLEIGTGTGWTAALLSYRLGNANVTSIEIDPAVAETAAANLKRSGFAPALVIGDGAAGSPDHAPFDRVHVTCGVTSVPYAWVEQTCPGGLIAFPWMPGHEPGHKTVLMVVGDGTAVGRFHGGARYMMLRAQRPSRGDRTDEGDWRESTTTLDPRSVVRTAHGADIAIAGLLPDLESQTVSEDHGAFQLWLWAPGSTAVAMYTPEHMPRVLQRGHRDLWSELSAAFRQWITWGMPNRDRFGMTVTPDGCRIWLDDPTKII